MSLRTIVTHVSPDLDACTSVWLAKRFLHGWEDATFSFVQPGKTLNDAPPDEDPTVMHVDTGLGKFDHHQLHERTSAARLVLDHINATDQLRRTNKEPLERLVDIVTLYDNFEEIHFDNPSHDSHMFSINEIVHGLRVVFQDDVTAMEYMMYILDGLLLSLKNKVYAEKELDKGLTVESKWGKTLIIETKNDEVLKTALKLGYTLAARKDPEHGFIRIKAFPDKKYDLTKLYDVIKTKDSQKTTWFFHQSGTMILNGSTKNTSSVPSQITTAQLVEIITSI